MATASVAVLFLAAAKTTVHAIHCFFICMLGIFYACVFGICFVWVLGIPFVLIFLAFEALFLKPKPEPRRVRRNNKFSNPSQAVPVPAAPILPHPLLPPSDRKTLFLDLDETLIVSYKDPPPDRCASTEGMMLTYRNRTYYVLKRPGVEQFLRTVVNSSFEVVIFTAGPRAYASPIMDWIDRAGELISHRLYQNACTIDEDGTYVRDLAFTGRPLDRSVVLTDDPALYWKHFKRAILFKPFDGDSRDMEMKKLMRFFIHHHDISHTLHAACIYYNQKY